MKIVALTTCMFVLSILQAQNFDSLNRTLQKETNPLKKLEITYYFGLDNHIARKSYWDSLYNEAYIQKSNLFQAHSLFQIGLTYRFQNNYAKGIDFVTQALKKYEALSDTSGQIGSWHSLATFYFDLEDYQKSQVYYLKSKKIIHTIKNEHRLAELYNGLGLLEHKYTKNYKLALEYLTKSLALFEKTHGFIAGSATANSIGAVYDALNQPQKAEEYYLKSLNFSQETNNQQHIAIALYNLGCNYYERNKCDKAEKYLYKSLHLSDSIGDLLGVELCHNDLYMMYNKQKKYDKALEHYVNYKAIRDSIYNKENTEKIIKTEMQYEYEKKEAVQQEQAKEQRNKIIFIGIMLLIIIAFALLAYIYINKQRKLKQERNTLLLEQKLLRLQMNPHFIFNCLGSIQSFVAINKPLIANQYLASLAVIMRRVLEDTVQEYVPLTTEIDLLQNYLKLHDMLLDDNLEYNVDILNGDKEKILVPSMVVQPFVENAIVHGIKKLKDEKGVISVVYDVKDKYIECRITNNGLGISQTQKNNNKHQSLALQIVTERLAILQNKDKRDVKINIKDLLNDNNHICGTIAILEMPYKTVV